MAPRRRGERSRGGGGRQGGTRSGGTASRGGQRLSLLSESFVRSRLIDRRVLGQLETFFFSVFSVARADQQPGYINMFLSPARLFLYHIFCELRG